MVHCLTWIRDLWSGLVSQPKDISDICGGFQAEKDSQVLNKRDDYSIFDIPEDIMVHDILSRLPPDSVLACRIAHPRWHHLTTSPRFVDLHLKRAIASPPITYIQFRSSTARHNMFFLEENTCFKNVNSNDVRMRKNFPMLIASCNGLLLLKKPFIIHGYSIYNPCTQEEVVLKESRHDVCGFFLDQLTKEYKLLRYDSTTTYETTTYSLYGLQTKKWKHIGRFRGHYPLNNTTCISLSLPRALFWMVYDRSLDGCIGSEPCFIHIMMFNLDKEEFSIIRHPKTHCHSHWFSTRPPPSCFMFCFVRLMEMDDVLSFCTVCSKIVDIWVLEDDVNGIWVRKYMVNLAGVLSRNANCLVRDHKVQVLSKHKDELVKLCG